MTEFRTHKKGKGKGKTYPIDNPTPKQGRYLGTTPAVAAEGSHDYRSYDMYELTPTAAPAQKLTQEDVWGIVDENWKRLDNGMIVAKSEEKCPVWGDKIPYKSVTAICKKEDEGDCEYWLEFVHGGGSVSRRKELPGGKVALRSDYKAW